MTNDEKIDSAIDRLLYLKGLALTTKTIAAYAHIDQAFEEVLSALHSVEAEKEPVNLPPAKPDLDPVEAHKRGEFVSDVEAAYNDGWNDCRHAAMYQPEWISFEERLPRVSDSDMNGCVWVSGCWGSEEVGVARIAWEDAGKESADAYWKPTGLRRPAPPEHKPE